MCLREVEGYNEVDGDHEADSEFLRAMLTDLKLKFSTLLLLRSIY